jgi:hypothetical protein
VAKKAIHTVPSPGGGWDNKKAGSSKPISHHHTKAPAQEKGKAAAEKAGAEHVIHGLDGKIQNKNSYGNDPCPPKDKK